MKRKEFLKNSAVILSVASVIPAACTKDDNIIQQTSSQHLTKTTAEECEVTPLETAGPYEKDLITNSKIFRSDIREDRKGLLLNLKLYIVNTNNNCQPVKNARVDIWHCDKDGYYSGFVNNGYLVPLIIQVKLFYMVFNFPTVKGLSIS